MDIVCGLLAEGQSLRKICRSEIPGIPSRPGTILEWLAEDSSLAEQYTRATVVRADNRFDSLPDRAQEMIAHYLKEGWEPKDAVNAAKLLIDTEKWGIARMSPRKYGDKIQQEVSGPEGGPVQVKIEI